MEHQPVLVPGQPDSFADTVEIIAMNEGIDVASALWIETARVRVGTSASHTLVESLGKSLAHDLASSVVRALESKCPG